MKINKRQLKPDLFTLYSSTTNQERVQEFLRRRPHTFGDLGEGGKLQKFVGIYYFMQSVLEHLINILHYIITRYFMSFDNQYFKANP